MRDLQRRFNEAYETLCAKQEASLSTPSEELQEEETIAYNRWSKLAAINEQFLKQRSKIHWLKVGDGNNKYFHYSAASRKMQNTIKELKTPYGVVRKKANINTEASRYFEDLLNRPLINVDRMDMSNIRSLIPFRCTAEMKENLVQPITPEEIRQVLYSMPNNKAPGPDGFTVEFYKGAWEVIAKDFTIAIQSFFQTGFLPKGVNSMILALIPKKENALEMKDYRPISCCNIVYKVISKLLAHKLCKVLNEMILPNQSAFIKNRLLMENVLLASELIKNYHLTDVSPRCALKIDISKAFDSVSWDFLLQMLECMEFPMIFINWIKICITTASFSVQVNGELVGYFGSSRGLRQGCPLSPYLFVICMNALSHMLNVAVDRHVFHYHPKCDLIHLTHLCFADDLIVFCEGSRSSVDGVIGVFESFERYSGLSISMEKSTIFMAGVSDQVRGDILQHYNFKAGTLPVRYLGLPLLTKRMNSTDYQPLVEKIRKKISSWTTKMLSYAGRIQLTISVLSSVINFWMAAFRLPKGCIKEIESMCSAFIWSGPSLNTRKAKVAWRDICYPRTEGGLGLRDINEINQVSCLKLI